MNIALQFTESEAKIVLEALMLQQQNLLEVCQTSKDEDAISDAGNDLVELRILLNRVRDAAVSHFGKGVLEFSREPL